MGSLDQIAKQRARGRQSSGQGGGGSLDQLAAHRRGGGSGVPGGIPTVQAPPAPAHHHGGGLLGGIERLGHFVADKSERAARDLKAMPGGLYDLANTEQHLLRLTAEHPLADPNDPRYGVNASTYGRHMSDLLHGLEHGTVESLKHPLRDPFATATVVLPAFGALGKAADIAAAGRISAADRALTVNGERVPLQASKQPATKAVQLAHDKVVQRAIDTNPEGRVAAYGTKRAGGSIAETARARGRLREVPASLLEQAAKRLTRHAPVRAGSRVEQAALELTSVQTTPEEAAGYHAAQAADQQATIDKLAAQGNLSAKERQQLVEARAAAPRNRALSKLYGRVAERGLLTKNEHGDVVVDAARHPKLAETDLRLADVQGRGDKVLARYGVASAEQLATRVGRPAEVRAGASYEPPTPGKLGRSPVLDVARRRVGSLQRRFDQLAGKDAGGYAESTRPRTPTEAQRLLAQLEKRHAGFEKAIYDRMFTEKLSPAELADQRFRNRENGRAARQASGKTRTGRASGASAWKSTKRQLVREDRWQQVEQEIQTALRAMGEHPSAKRFLAERDQMHRLQEALTVQPEEAFGGTPAARTAGQLGTVTEARYKGPTRPRLERLGGALSVAKDELHRVEQQTANRVRQTGFGTAASRLQRRIAAHPDKLVSEYERKFKNVVATDNARELSPEYAASKESRARLAASVHEPASAIAKLVYRRKLARRPRGDKTVTFTGGGTGAGKSTGVVGHLDLKRADIVYDTNLNSVASSVEKIDAALKSGRDVKILYVYREPVEALVHGALPRAERMGRTVPLHEHVQTHVGSNEAIRQLADHYAGNPRVKVTAIANTNGKGGARAIPLADVPVLRHDVVSHEVRSAYEAEHAAGRVSPAVHEGTAGARPVDAGVRGRAESGGGDGQVRAALERRAPGFISYRTEEPRAPKSAAASAAGPVVGEARSPITKQVFTGQGIEKGLVPNDITGMAARHFHQIIRFVNTSEHRLQAIRTGSPVRTSSRDVLVRVPGADHAKIPAAVNEILGKSKLTTDDVEGLNAALQEFKAELVPGLRDRFASDRAHGIGANAPDGYVWVDRNVLGDLAKPGQGPRGRIARSLDNVNSAVTAATVYFKIGHVGTRVLTNAATNIIQGSAAPAEIARSVNLWHGLSDVDRARALAAAGQHGFAAMPHEGVSVAARVAGHGARWWAKHADAPFRFNSIAYEARKAGFDTPAKFRGMLDQLENPHGLDAAQTAKVDWVAKRANREAIAYDRLSEAERRFLTRGIWFYPWVKGTIGFAVNTALEHPYKAGVLGAAALHGLEQQQQQLGDVPSYVGGLFELGGSKSRPLVADFSTFSPFATPADVLGSVARPGQLSNQLTPALAALTHLGFGLDQYGNTTNAPVTGALSTLVSPTPEAQILTAYLNRNKPQGRKMFPASPALHGTLSPLLRALLGPGTPRRLNPSAAHSAASRERRGLR